MHPLTPPHHTHSQPPSIIVSDDCLRMHLRPSLEAALKLIWLLDWCRVQHRYLGLKKKKDKSDGRAERATRLKEIKVYEDAIIAVLWPFLHGEKVNLWHSVTGHFVVFLVILVCQDIVSYNILQIYNGFEALEAFATQYKKEHDGEDWNQSPQAVWQYIYDGGLLSFIAEELKDNSAGAVHTTQVSCAALIVWLVCSSMYANDALLSGPHVASCPTHSRAICNE
jgi:hypothetical protein